MMVIVKDKRRQTVDEKFGKNFYRTMSLASEEGDHVKRQDDKWFHPKFLQVSGAPYSCTNMPRLKREQSFIKIFVTDVWYANSKT
ncbi:unnamed protein product [Haemonchus placei]|uniref:Ovule protein n=1 Tax=Haemonchus placei TaxID=6290 RepID=A0A0N4WZ97_HAEPC|nr:unnamed protein product [Haemonchus placei]